MPPPVIVNPLEALKAVTEKIKKGKTTRVPVEDCVGHFLADPIPGPRVSGGFPWDPPDTLRAAIDGYALPDGSGTGDQVDIQASPPEADSAPGQALLPGAGIRVEVGSPLPVNTWAILPVGDGTLLVGGKLRIDHLPQPGEGIAGKETSSPGEFKSGSLLSPREQAYLLAAGIQNVGVHCLPRVGVLLLGNELTDLKAEKEVGQVYDLNGYWLTSSIQALGLDVIPFGISEDGPEGLRKHLVRCHTRQVDILMISGGTGAGITDRTAEAIREMNGKVLFEKLSLHGCDSLVFGKLNNMDVLALSGRPLSCAAGFDLYGRPLILARSGAAKGYWNWANVLYQDETLTPPPPSNNRQLEWCLQAGKLIGNRSEPVTLPVVKAWNPETLFSPVVPGSEGWILRPPGPLENPVYFSRHSQQVF